MNNGIYEIGKRFWDQPVPNLTHKFLVQKCTRSLRPTVADRFVEHTYGLEFMWNWDLIMRGPAYTKQV